MSFWKQFPFIRLTVAFITGIWAGFMLPVIPSPSVLVAVIVIMMVLLVMIFSKKISYAFRWIPGLGIYLTVAVFALIITRSKNNFNSPGHISTFPSSGVCLADVAEPVVQKRRSTKVILEIVAISENGKWKRSHGKVLVYLEKDPLSQQLCYGDRLVMKNSFREPVTSLNPGGFDSKQYLKFKGICRQGYLKKEQWKKTGSNNGNPVISLALSWRNSLLEIFRRNGLQGKEFAVAAALLLGYVDEIDTDLMHDYSVTGAMHILSVSGMHVGVIFIFLQKILGFLNKRRREILLKSFISIMLIWLYALITGLSPAVLRAAAMITLVIISSFIRRNTQILNILGVSFFFLLLWDPNLLFDLGFQLSYVAVAGIVILYKPIYDIFITENWLLEKIWSVMAVSIAAQLSTLPLCLYFFHQFPNFFLLTNLVVVPVSNAVIYLGILCLTTGIIPYISYIVSRIFYCSVWFLNNSIHFIGSLPYAVTTGIFTDTPEMVLLYIVIITGVFFAFEKKKKWLFMTLSVLLFFFSYNLLHKTMIMKQSKMTVYQTKSSFLMDCMSNEDSFLVGNLRATDDAFFTQGMNNYHMQMLVRERLRMTMEPGIINDNIFDFGDHLIKSAHFVCFKGRRAAVVKNKLPGGFRGVIRVDFVIISGNPRITIKDLLQVYKTRTVVLDASNSVTSCRKWLKEAAGLRIYCHSVRESGAFVMEF